MFKRCKHEKLITMTNIYGDPINHFNGRSIKVCVDCGKQIVCKDLDTNCKRGNEFNLPIFHIPAENIGDISDGYHTFDELYHHRTLLFAIICNTYKDISWKSWKHYDGTMYDNMFIVGIDTPMGQYRYHCEKEYWDRFDIKELPNAPIWDGHKPEDIDRLFSILK